VSGEGDSGSAVAVPGGGGVTRPPLFVELCAGLASMSVVRLHVLRVGRMEPQVLEPVVCAVAVDVVDDLATRQRPAHVQRHDHPVLADASLLVDHRRPLPAVGGEHADVSGRRHGPPALPPRRIRPGDPLAGSLGVTSRRLDAVRLVLAGHERVAARLRARRPAGVVELAGTNGTRLDSHVMSLAEDN